MKNSKFYCELSLLCGLSVFLICILSRVQSVEIECIPMKSCPLILQILSKNKQSPEMIEFVKFSHCGYDEWKQPMVWCSILNFCKTPDNRNGTCTPMKKCKPFLDMMAILNTLDYHNQNYLNQFRCNNILEEVHVCCPESPQFPYSTELRPPSETNTYKNRHNPPVRNRFDYEINYEDDYSDYVGDEPESYNNHYHGRSHGFQGNSHRHVHMIDLDSHKSWDDNYYSTHQYDHTSTPNYDTEHTVHKNNEVSGNRNIFDERNSREVVNVNHNRNSVHHSSTSSTSPRSTTTSTTKIRSSTTPKNRSATTSKSRSTTTPKSRTTSTPKSRSYTTTKGGTTRGRVTPRDWDAIVFEDSAEDFTADKPLRTTERSTTIRSQAERKSNKSSCETPDRKTGVCMKEADCQHFSKLKSNLDKSKKSVRDYLFNFKCTGTNPRETYICCQKDEETGIDNSVLYHERTNENIPEPDSKVCGRQSGNNNKIFGGGLADLGEFPWMALLRYPSSKGMMFGCGGSLISNRHVLTAAHCVDENILKSKGLGKLRQVVLGEYDTRNKTDCIYMDFGEDCADPPKTVEVESIIRHSDYNTNTTRNDIAIIKLNQEVNFTDYIKPICLPTKTSKLNGNETFIIAGWGRTPTEPSSPILKKARISYVQKENCNARAQSTRTLIDGQICAGVGNNTDSCNGDSGGPLMLNVNFNFEFVTHIVGIISYGFGECASGPSVNTYVPYYVDWIKENMR